MSDERRDIFKLLQQIAATIERATVEKGFKAKSFAGGSCKQLFCRNHLKCNLLAGRECRNPEYARPSMSGFGINVSKLMELCGWKLEWRTGKDEADMATVCGQTLPSDSDVFQEIRSLCQANSLKRFAIPTERLKRHLP